MLYLAVCSHVRLALTNELNRFSCCRKVEEVKSWLEDGVHWGKFWIGRGEWMTARSICIVLLSKASIICSRWVWDCETRTWATVIMVAGVPPPASVLYSSCFFTSLYDSAARWMCCYTSRFKAPSGYFQFFMSVGCGANRQLLTSSKTYCQLSGFCMLIMLINRYLYRFIWFFLDGKSQLQNRANGPSKWTEHSCWDNLHWTKPGQQYLWSQGYFWSTLSSKSLFWWEN